MSINMNPQINQQPGLIQRANPNIQIGGASLQSVSPMKTARQIGQQKPAQAKQFLFNRMSQARNSLNQQKPKAIKPLQNNI